MVFDYILPDFKVMRRVQIEGSVNKFDEPETFCHKKCNFRKSTLKRQSTHLFIYRRKAVSAVKRAAARRFVIDYTVFYVGALFKRRVFCINKRNLVKLNRQKIAGKAAVSKEKAFYRSQRISKAAVFSFCKFYKYVCNRPLAFAFDDERRCAAFFKDGAALIRNFRAAETDCHFWENLLYCVCHDVSKTAIPYIDRK